MLRLRTRGKQRDRKTLQGQVAVVTGASRGLGSFIAEALAAAGADLVLTARTAEAPEEVAGRARDYGSEVLVVPGDISTPETRQKLVEEATSTFGHVDILINNAGLFETAAFCDLSPDTIDSILGVNVGAMLHLTHAFLPGMLERKRGNIVNLASLAGRVGPAYSTVYAATKGAEIAATHSLHATYRDSGVKFTVVCPGFVSDTGMWHDQAMSRGVKTSRLVGSSSPQAVVAAVFKAIEKGPVEILVNTPPMRPLLVIGEISPRFRHFVLRMMGVNRAFKRTAELSEDR